MENVQRQQTAENTIFKKFESMLDFISPKLCRFSCLSIMTNQHVTTKCTNPSYTQYVLFKYTINLKTLVHIRHKVRKVELILTSKVNIGQISSSD